MPTRPLRYTLAGVAAAWLAGATLLPGTARAEAGGPDWFEVTGVAANDALNVRTGPSTRERIVDRLPNGTIVRNVDCGERAGRWCRIALGDRPVEGWVARRFLREAVPPGEPGGAGTLDADGRRPSR